MTAPGSRASGGGAALHPADPTAAGEEQSLLWRRHIYLQGLYALPLSEQPPKRQPMHARSDSQISSMHLRDNVLLILWVTN